MDILLGFVHKTTKGGKTTKRMKELILLKKYGDDKRKAFKVRLEHTKVTKDDYIQKSGSKFPINDVKNIGEKLLKTNDSNLGDS